MVKLNKPIITIDTIKGMEDMSYFTHALIFDDLLIVAQKETNCFVLKTTEGLIVIDAIWPCKEAFEAIKNAIFDVSWNPKDIKKLVLTHGHADHTGCGRWIKDNYKCRAYLSEVDDNYWRCNPIKPNNPKIFKDYEIDKYIKDGDKITLGDKTIFVYSTPGHTPGGLSFIFNVTEKEQTYHAALFGGTNPPNNLKGLITYMKSLDYFINEAGLKNVTVALTNHTAIDNGHERILYSKKRMAYMPNIYVLKENEFRNFFSVFKNLAYDKLENLL